MQANFLFSRSFTALFAGHAFENSGLGGRFIGRLTKGEYFFYRQGHKLLLKGCPVHCFMVKLPNQTNTQFFPFVSEEKAEGLFTPISKDQVALAQSAAGEELDRIQTAGIVFSNADQFFVLGKS